MPIKVRCRDCEKSLSIPDALRGKTVKCPGCGAKLKIPAADSVQPAKAAKVSRKAAQPDEEPSGELFANLNLKNVESEDGAICRFCAEPMPDPEVSTVCPSCGMDSASGRMDKKEARRRQRKGPDIKEFWGKAWSDPFNFIREHSGLAIRTGTFWLQFSLIFALCFFMANDYCDKGPTITFWAGLTIISGLGIPGWYWTLAIKLSQTEIFREKVNSDRIHFDFFANVALGLRAVIWPFVVLLPAWIVVMAIRTFMPESLPDETFKWVGLGLFVAPFVTFPLATAHMTARYQYKAWILWELLVTFAQCAAACFYWLIQACIVLGPIALLLFSLHQWGGGLNPYSNTYVDQWAISLTTKFMTLIGEQPNQEGITFTLVRMAVEFMFAVLILVPLCYISAFPAVFMMRSNAVLAGFFQGRLGLVNDMPRNTPATFWVRFLAFFGDLFLTPLAPVLVMRDKRFVIIGMLLIAGLGLTWIFQGTDNLQFQILVPTFFVYSFWMYFAVSESGALRATTVKEAFGLIVQSSPKGKQLTLQQATTRLFGTVLSAATLGLGFLMCAFTPGRKALQDKISKTECVWSGDK